MKLMFKVNIGQVKSIYMKLLMNFIQIFSLLNFFTELEGDSIENAINLSFEIFSGYFFSIIFLECLFQGNFNKKNYKFK